MDKLKGAMKHKFWILFGLMIPVVAYGYMAANSAVKPLMEERTSTLKTAAQTASQSYATTPNETYKVGLQGFADQLAASNEEVLQGLWLNQLKDMTWPGVVANLMEGKKLRGYRAIEKAEGDKLVTLRRKYAEEYVDQIRELFKRFEPFVGDEYDNKDADWPQKVLILESAIPQQRILVNSNVTASQMWDAQEDIWFTDVIADVVRELNAESDGIGKAAIRRIDQLKLFGATGEPVLSSASAAGSSFEDYGSDYGSDYGEDYGGASLGGATAKKTKVDFDTASVFGTSSEGGAADLYGEGSYDYENIGTTAAAAKPAMRYIGEVADGEKFRERAFYISLLIEQDRLDDFLIELSSARWPIRIARFQVGPNPYFKEIPKTPRVPGGGAGYPGGGYPGGGYPGGGYPGEEYLSEDYGSGEGEYGGEYDSEYGEGYPGGGGGEFGVTAANVSAVNDPVAAAAVASADLVHLTLAGAITLYGEPPAELFDVTRYPIPVQGQPYEMPPADDGESADASVAFRDPEGTSTDPLASN